MGTESQPVTRIAQAVALLARAASAELLKRAFFQLNDDLARIGVDTLAEIRSTHLPSDPSQAALVAAALAFRYESLGHEPAQWLSASNLVAPQPVFLTQGLDDLIRQQTPKVVAQHNVFIDQASLSSL